MSILLLTACAPPPAPPAPPHPAFPEARALAEAPPLARTDVIPTAQNEPTKHEPMTEPATPVEPPAPADPLAELEGDYRYASGSSSVGKAIDEVVDAMSVFVRGIAKKRLTAANEVPKHIAIERKGDEVTVEIDGRPYAAELGGGPRNVRDPHGEKSRMRLSMRGESLYQTFTTGEGVRTNVFTPRSKGGVTMSVRITSKKLPADVHYRLAFADAR